MGAVALVLDRACEPLERVELRGVHVLDREIRLLQLDEPARLLEPVRREEAAGRDRVDGPVLGSGA